MAQDSLSAEIASLDLLLPTRQALDSTPSSRPPKAEAVRSVLDEHDDEQETGERPIVTCLPSIQPNGRLKT